MEKTNVWKDVAKYGAIIGALLAVSFMLETRLMLSASFGLYALEWIVVVALHYYLLHRFTRQYSMNNFSIETGFSFGQGYGYVLSVSAVAGIIVGVVQYLYLHLFIGYANYTERISNTFTEYIAQNGGVPASMESMLAQTFEQLQNAPEPSMLKTVWGGTFSGVLFGAIFGLIIAGVLARAPKPFDNTAANE